MKTGKNTTRNNGGAILDAVIVITLILIGIAFSIRIYKFDKLTIDAIKQNANHPK